MMKKFYILSLLLFFLTACGNPLEDQQPEKKILDISNFSVDCSFNYNNFYNFTKIDLQQDIDCLEKHFDIYQQAVKHDDKSELKLQELNGFLSMYLPKKTAPSFEMLNFVFKMVQLLQGGKEEVIEYRLLPQAFQALKFLNRQSLALSHTQRNNKTRLLELTLKTLEGLTPFLIENARYPGKIDLAGLEQFLQDIGISKEKLGSLSLAQNFKPLLLGGESSILTQKELKTLISQMPLLLETIKQMPAPGEKKNIDPLSQIHLLKSIIKLLSAQRSPGDALTETELLQLNDLYLSVEKSKPPLLSKERIGQLIFAKNYFLGGSPDAIEFSVIDDFLNFAEKVIPLSPLSLLLAPAPQDLSREEFSKNVEIIQNNLTAIINDFLVIPPLSNLHPVLTPPIILSALPQFFEKKENKKNLNRLFMLKQLLKGGSSNEIRIEELRSLLPRLPQTLAEYYYLKNLKADYFPSKIHFWIAKGKAIKRLLKLHPKAPEINVFNWLKTLWRQEKKDDYFLY